MKKNILFVLSGNFAFILLSALTSIFIIRIVTPEQFGFFSQVNVMAGLFTSLGGLGIGVALVRFIPIYQEKHDVKALMSSAAVVVSALFVLLSIAFFICSFFFASMFNTPVFYYQAGVLLLFPGLFLNFTYSVTQGFQKMKTYSLLLVSNGVLILLSALIFLSYHPFAESVMLSYFIGSSIISLAGLFLFKNELQLCFPDFGIIKKLVVFGFPLVFSGFFSFVLANVDKLVIAYYLKPEDIAFYAVASTTIWYARPITASASTVIFPKTA